MHTINLFWFRRDLRLNDNTALQKALHGHLPVLCIFIFDKAILGKLPKEDKRVDFIHYHVALLKTRLEEMGSSLLVLHDEPLSAFKMITNQYRVSEVFCNHDYEPYSIHRDNTIADFLKTKNTRFSSYKDQVVFERSEVTKADGSPYTVFTPYSKKWKEKYLELGAFTSPKNINNYLITNPFDFPELKDMGFQKTNYQPEIPVVNRDIISKYNETRDIPGIHGTTGLGVHLRFGTVSIRELASLANTLNALFLNELIWREFFMSILYHFPYVQKGSFKKEYDNIEWRNNSEEFERWCKGETGYPIVDAGMRELNTTGFMHNRVRMITASFLVKDLLIDWRWGEAWFAEKLLDFELASNNGNWQWSAGTGCDSAPYFRIFNPAEQTKRFDPDHTYIKKWVPEYRSSNYTEPIVDHSFARNRTLNAYKNARIR